MSLQSAARITGKSGGSGGGVSSVTASLPLTSSGGSTPNIALNQPSATQVWYSNASGVLTGDALFTRLSSSNHDTNMAILNIAGGQTGLSLISGTNLATLSSVDNTGAGSIFTLDSSGDIIAQTGAFGNFTIKDNAGSRIFNTAVGSGDVEVGDVDGVFNNYQYILSQSTSEHVFIGANYQFNTVDYVMPSVQGTAGQFLAISSVTATVGTLHWATGISPGGAALIGETSGIVSNPTAITGDETWLGQGAGGSSASKTHTVLLGVNAGVGSTIANNLIAIGNSAGQGLTVAGGGVIAIGALSLQNATSATNSIAIGTSAGQTASAADHSIFIGQSAGSGATQAFDAFFVGNVAGQNATLAAGSNFFGNGSGAIATNANDSIFIGNHSGFQATNAAHGIFLGENAGASDTVDTHTSGFGSNGFAILIGQNTNTGGFKNSILMGGVDSGTVSNTAINQFMLVDSITHTRLSGIEYIFPSAQATAGQILTATSISAGIATLGWETIDAQGKIQWQYATSDIGAPGDATTIDLEGTSFSPSDISGNTLTIRGLNGATGYAGAETFLGSDAGQGASTVNTTMIGIHSGDGATNADNTITIGNNAGFHAQNAHDSIFIGNTVAYIAPNAANCIFIGNNVAVGDSIDNTVSGASILIGNGTSTGAFQNSVAIGTGATNTVANQFLIDAPSFPFTDIAFNSTTGTFRVGDINSVGNGTQFIIDDSTGTVNINHAGSLFMTTGGSQFQFGNINGSGRLVYSQWDVVGGGITEFVGSGWNVIDAATQSVISASIGSRSSQFGDLDGGGNHTSFFVNDSTETITATATNGVVLTSPLVNIGSIPYNFPAAQGGLSQGLINDGSGNLNWESVPITIGGQDQTGNTGSQTLVVASITGNHTFQVNPYLTVRAISAGTLTMMVNYTDETNTSRSIVLTPQGLTSGVLNATGVYLFPATTIRSNGTTNITVTVTFAGVSTTWDGGAYILQLN